MIQVSVISTAVLRAGAAVGIFLGLREIRRTAEVVPDAARSLKSFIVPISIVAAAVLAWVVLKPRGGS